MRGSICRHCHTAIQARLRQKIHHLQATRRGFQSSSSHSDTKDLQSWYWDTVGPTPEQLQAAQFFFRTHLPRKIWTGTEWQHKDKQESSKSGALTPEVAFLGRSNVGKSSLLNALMNAPNLNYVGPNPGKTKTMHAWGLSAVNPLTGGAIKGMRGQMDTKMIVLDVPGYGYHSQATWGEEIVKYLRQRKQLRRVFVLCDPRHLLKKGDKDILALLRVEGISHQIVASKCDRLDSSKDPNVLSTALEKIKMETEPPPAGNSVLRLGEILAVGSLGDNALNKKVNFNNIKGVRNVQWAVLKAVGLEQYALDLASGKRPSAVPQATSEKPRETLKLAADSLEKAPAFPETSAVSDIKDSSAASLLSDLEIPAWLAEEEMEPSKRQSNNSPRHGELQSTNGTQVRSQGELVSDPVDHSQAVLPGPSPGHAGSHLIQQQQRRPQTNSSSRSSPQPSYSELSQQDKLPGKTVSDFLEENSHDIYQDRPSSAPSERSPPTTNSANFEIDKLLAMLKQNSRNPASSQPTANSKRNGDRGMRDVLGMMTRSPRQLPAPDQAAPANRASTPEQLSSPRAVPSESNPKFESVSKPKAKGLGYGMDDLLAMTGATTSQKSKHSHNALQSTSRRGQDLPAMTPASTSQMSRTGNATPSKSLGRGMDDLLAMTGAHDSATTRNGRGVSTRRRNRRH